MNVYTIVFANVYATFFDIKTTARLFDISSNILKDVMWSTKGQWEPE